MIVYFGDQALKPPTTTEIVSVFGFVGRMDRARRARSLVRGFSLKLQVTLSKSGSARAPCHKDAGCTGAVGPGEEGTFTQPVLKSEGPRRVPRYFVIVGE